ncbi:MAG: NAD-dependent epimerase [Neisseriaceae bacterium]|nr:MAG: NAD-dependent epimerase [Neisseriaceae bacterium]
MKILVTGSAGFIGFHLVKALASKGHEIIGIDNINDYYDQNLKYARLQESGINREFVVDNLEVSSTTLPCYTFIKMDITDRAAMEQLFIKFKFDAVCNLAAQAGVRYSLQNPYSYVESNVVGFLNILEGCRHNSVKHLVYASSSSVYGMNKKQPFSTEDNVDYPISIYAATKKSNELMAHCYSHLYNFQTTGLRFFTVYGPWGRPDMAPILFADAISNDSPIKVFNNGDLERDFTYIDDIVIGIVNILEQPANMVNPDESSTPSALYKLYNIGNNKPVKLMDFIQTIEINLGKESLKEFLPMQAGDVYSTYADIEPLINDFSYRPDTSIIDGISAFIKWFREYYQK